jgi:hypothetical protein
MLHSLGPEEIRVGFVSPRLESIQEPVTVRREQLGLSCSIEPAQQSLKRWVGSVRGYCLYRMSAEQISELGRDALRSLTPHTIRYMRYVEALSLEQWRQIASPVLQALTPDQLKRLLLKVPHLIPSLAGRLSAVQRWLLVQWNH